MFEIISGFVISFRRNFNYIFIDNNLFITSYTISGADVEFSVVYSFGFDGKLDVFGFDGELDIFDAGTFKTSGVYDDAPWSHFD